MKSVCNLHSSGIQPASYPTGNTCVLQIDLVTPIEQSHSSLPFEVFPHFTEDNMFLVPGDKKHLNTFIHYKLQGCFAVGNNCLHVLESRYSINERTCFSKSCYGSATEDVKWKAFLMNNLTLAEQFAWMCVKQKIDWLLNTGFPCNDYCKQPQDVLVQKYNATERMGVLHICNVLSNMEHHDFILAAFFHYNIPAVTTTRKDELAFKMHGHCISGNQHNGLSEKSPGCFLPSQFPELSLLQKVKMNMLRQACLRIVLLMSMVKRSNCQISSTSCQTHAGQNLWASIIMENDAKVA